MAQQQSGVQMPGVFGGLMRYDEEIGSRFQLSPIHVVSFVVGILLFVLLLKFVFPISS